MGVRVGSKHEAAAKLRPLYRKANREEKRRMLDGYVELTGYHRRYALTLLRRGPPEKATTRRTGRPSVYGYEVLAALRVAAEATNWICGKRLAPALAELVPALEREGAVRLSDTTRAALLGMSPATIDRRLAALRVLEKPRGLATTKPGSLLKRQIPIRTYTPWDEQRPGFVEIDLVAHCGTTTAGTYLLTLDVVDIATGWTECAAVANKGQAAVFEALVGIRRRLPFPLLGIDSDNGSEFINDHLVRYCQTEQITFTRCRAYHKNDQAHVEQKNWSVVRKLVGYDRYETPAAVLQFGRVYDLARTYVNGYLPVMKLIGKERDGAKVRKHYDVPMTPFRRAQAARAMVETAAAAFSQALLSHGPLGLRRALDTELERLWALRVGASQLPRELAG